MSKKLTGQAAIAYFQANDCVSISVAKQAVHGAAISGLMKRGHLTVDITEEDDPCYIYSTSHADDTFIPDNQKDQEFLIRVKELALQLAQIHANVEINHARCQARCTVAEESAKVRQAKIAANAAIRRAEIDARCEEIQLNAQYASQRLFGEIFTGTVRAVAEVALSAIPLIDASRNRNLL